jgi:heterodisulfide reductase subunit A
MELGEPDESGRRRPVPLAGSEFNLPADTVIAAISQVPVLEGLEALDHEGNWLLADSHGALGADVIAGGDALGLGIAGEAIVQGRRAAEGLHRRFRGLEADPDRDPQKAEIDGEHVLFESKPGSEPVHGEKLPGAQRVSMGMAEVEHTIDEKDFLAEVDRCFSCGSCFGCEQCYMYCTSGCFTRVEEAGPGMYFTINLDNCKECGKCIEVCPCGFLEVTPAPDQA